MTFSQALVGAAALIGAAIFAVHTMAAGAQAPGPFALSSVAGANSVWRINTASGAVSLCYTASHRDPPQCSSWTQ
jgi:hypothetical protein